MSPDQPALFTDPPKPPGPYARELGRTLDYWTALGHLTEDSHAATRAILAGMARLADAAEQSLTPYATPFHIASAAGVVERFRLALITYAPLPPPPRDSQDDRLEAEALAIIAAHRD